MWRGNVAENLVRFHFEVARAVTETFSEYAPPRSAVNAGPVGPTLQSHPNENLFARKVVARALRAGREVISYVRGPDGKFAPVGKSLFPWPGGLTY
jgi:hypothetical protein